MTETQALTQPEVARKRVCVVTSTFPRWRGDTVPHFVLELASDIAGNDWHVEVLAPHFDRALTHEEMHGVRITRFRYLWPATLETLAYGDGGAVQSLRRKPWNTFKIPFYFFALVVALYRLVRKQRIDVINSHWLLPQGLAAAFVSRLTGVPHVATVHGGDVLGLRSAGFLRAKRIALKMASACTANSSVTEAAVRKLAPKTLRIEKIPLGANPLPAVTPEVVSASRERYAGASQFLLLFVGRLIAQKGCSDLLAAMKLVSNANANTKLIIAGDGPERLPLLEAAVELGISDRIEFTGWLGREELVSLYRAADLFVASPTRGPGGEVEAFGLVFVEAALAALPTVATRSGGIADVVVNGETGVLVAEGDPDGLARAILGFANDPEKAERMGLRARERAQALFTRDRAAAAFCGLFDDVAGKYTG